ncbi:Zn-ribbon domain-containing OB-fold protein [Roseovarius phycicola]|uniref:OB-fold domain-containing protein n=1 Tax=Roseovarius phycicola TaxID=3080976 RepID=A0ABZ2HPP0_9RHOB
MKTVLQELSVPGPTVTALTEPFWNAVKFGRLMIQHCAACHRAVFYPRTICPHCWADALTWTEATGQGRLKSYSEIWKPGHPGWIPATPYLVGLVELDEGPTMLSHILADGAKVTVGDAVHFAPTQIGDQILPCFKIT